MASEIRVDKINSLSGVGTVTLSPTGVDIAGITTAATLRATTGIVTSLTAVSSAKVGSGVTLSPDGDIFATGVCTATSFSGSGASLTNLPAANITGTLPAISGANLTSLPAQATIANNADNRVITGGSGVNLNGESGLTYDGSDLNVSAGAHDSGMTITAANNNQETRLNVKGKASDGTVHTVTLTAKRSANRGDIEVGGSARVSMTSDGKVGINQSAPTSELQVGGGTNPMSAKPTFHVAPSSGNATMSLRGGSPSIYFDGTSGGHTRFLTDSTDIAISDGNLDSAGTERFRFRSGGGLCFNGDTAAANALDDYEEGTWTVNTTVGSPNTTHGASYTKIGRSVTVSAYITCPTSSDGNNFRITSLPFTSLGGSNYAVGAAYTQVHTTDNVFVQVNPGNNDLYVYKRVGNSVTFADLSGAYLLFTVTYFEG